ncbi:ABC transporter permease [Pseudonocardia sp. TRM90224]|uniref:ABC transporter permease n=1 Tax=Pseudonocardia sp. TRM90224 TaxID=2812678 RepID=UPI001E3F8F5D|nr:ABC transporter permease [Pseudonocardia sp. TRM90224]
MNPGTNPTATAMSAGLQRGWIEFRQTVTSVGEMMGWLWIPVAALIVMYAVGGAPVAGTNVSLGAQAVPGIIGMNLVFTGLMGLAMGITTDRDDGTLLRARATPNGIVGYLTGKVAGKAAMTVALLVIVLVPAGLMFDGLRIGEPVAWLTLGWVLVLGLLATLPMGAVLGAMFSNAQNLGFLALLIFGLTGISGVFYPLTAMPEWLQWVAQVFPVYWLGLGMRSALLPDAFSAVEIGGSWRHLEMLGVLGAWAVLGLLLAPVLLRRMARRQSGSVVEERRRQVQQYS